MIVWTWNLWASCAEPNCGAVIEVAGQQKEYALRKLREAGWSYSAGGFSGYDSARCPQHRKRRRPAEAAVSGPV